MLNKTISSPIALAVQMLCWNLALLDEANGSKIELVKPIDTKRTWKLKGLVDALELITEESLDTAHSSPPGYYDNLYGFRDGYDPEQYYGGPAVMSDRVYKFNKLLFHNKPPLNPDNYSPHHTNERIDRNCCIRYQRPEDINHGFYYRGFPKPVHQQRFHYPYHITKTANHYHNHIYKNMASVPYNGYPFGGHNNYGASIYSNLFIPSFRNKHFSQTGKRTGVYLIPTPDKYYVDNVSLNKTSTVTAKPLDISTLILSLSNSTSKDGIQMEDIKRKIQ